MTNITGCGIVYDSPAIIGQCPMNMNILVPKIVAVFSRLALMILIKFE